MVKVLLSNAGGSGLVPGCGQFFNIKKRKKNVLILELHGYWEKCIF